MRRRHDGITIAIQVHILELIALGEHDGVARVELDDRVDARNVRTRTHLWRWHRLHGRRRVMGLAVQVGEVLVVQEGSTA